MDNQNTWIIALVVICLLVFLSFFGFGSMMYGNYGYGMMRNIGFGSMGIFGWLFMILIIVALVLFCIWLVKQIQRGKR